MGGFHQMYDHSHWLCCAACSLLVRVSCFFQRRQHLYLLFKPCYRGCNVCSVMMFTNQFFIWELLNPLVIPPSAETFTFPYCSSTLGSITALMRMPAKLNIRNVIYFHSELLQIINSAYPVLVI